MRFLLVEDTPDLGQAVLDRLTLDGHGVDWARSLAEAEAHLAVSSYDLILLDIMLPDGDGRDFLAAHRRVPRDTPVIVMTARAGVSDRVALLDTGADDYVTKPFDFAELEARVRAVLRRRGGTAQTQVIYADLVFDPLGGTVAVGGDVRDLRNRELRLLEILMAGPGRIFSKGHLHDRLLSASEAVSDNAIEVYVGRLRKKLSGSAARIETVRGVGYRLTQG
ncbi:two-component system, OmpR family, response regulator TctD [Loktanella sp. DSM 29012]|uniref:Response regulator transcription factor n=1 Tax=Loktanella gaetbuli TaxID=2881335 RepID=A0ABS8BS26_9RHOB|nr:MULTISPECIES: response regulator transcription factor [Loktanella]MCB5198543.1 response regulator transcription factor [Loktanella gaetbuli]SEQ58287.1 two-component system, OmpR family, response regulator TctD [Loktanella sp. DSM 29012]